MMKRSDLDGLRIVAVRSKKYARKIDYYLVRNNKRFYAFTRDYSVNTYRLCKREVLVNRVLDQKKRDTSVMNLVKYRNYILSFLLDYYDLKAA